jgi:hypothetical protein
LHSLSSEFSLNVPVAIYVKGCLLISKIIERLLVLIIGPT